MIISGEALIYIFKSNELSEKFFKLGLICRSVICCRVSAKQKSQVVKLVKSLGNWITLAVGDGTNDVPMIMEANIGVGIQGVEGTQAVRSADYGICRFKYLQRLILIHGRNGYRRISNFICYYFYKNIILVFAEIYFVYYSGYSGQPFFPNFLPTLYNSVWTSWPCIFAYSIESDIIDNTFEKFCKNELKDKNNLLGKNFEILPKLYRAGQLKYYFNMKIFWLWLLYAIIHGGLSYILISIGIHLHSCSGDGKLVDHWWVNTVIFSCIIHIVTYKIFIEITYWNRLVIGTSILSIFLYYLSIILINLPIFARSFQIELLEKVNNMLLSSTFWIYIVTLPLLVFVFDFTLKNLYKFFNPSPVDIINMDKINSLDKTDIVGKMTNLKESGEIFNKKSIMSHYQLMLHNNKHSKFNIELLRNNLDSKDQKNGFDHEDSKTSKFDTINIIDNIQNNNEATIKINSSSDNLIYSSYGVFNNSDVLSKDNDKKINLINNEMS